MTNTRSVFCTVCRVEVLYDDNVATGPAAIREVTLVCRPSFKRYNSVIVVLYAATRARRSMNPAPSAVHVVEVYTTVVVVIL